MTAQPEAIMENTRVELQEGIFQKYQCQNDLQKAEQNYKKLYDQNIHDALTTDNFYCVFCKDISSFRIDEIKEYESHLKRIHSVRYEHEILRFVNFIDKEKKSNVIHQAKKFVKRGDLYSCKLCKARYTNMK